MTPEGAEDGFHLCAVRPHLEQLLDLNPLHLDRLEDALIEGADLSSDWRVAEFLDAVLDASREEREVGPYYIAQPNETLVSVTYLPPEVLKKHP